jgi:acyl carrier protein
MHGVTKGLARECSAESPLVRRTKTVSAAGLVDNSNISAGERIIAVVQRMMNERSITRPVSCDDTLAEAGLTSLDAVRLVLLVEDEFKVEIPIREMTLANFRSISTLSRLVTRLVNST